MKMNMIMNTIILVLTKTIVTIVVISKMMIIANIMAMTYVMTMFIVVDEVDDGYEDVDEEFDKGPNPLYNHDYDDNLSHAYDNGCDLDHF